ncbi:MAG: hypothetical protein ACI9YM_000931 [Brevundimonas sp.]|jgi:hypothetical protein|uniref:hypothetical protein n=1 Tax=Brevundimonas sp. TaxID=1871086 RepID=UPI0039E46DA3
MIRRLQGLLALIAIATALTGMQTATARQTDPLPTTGSLAATDPIMNDGSHFDCYVVPAEPGSILGFGMTSSTFQPVLMIARGPDCASPGGVLYFDLGDRGDRRQAGLHFRAQSSQYLLIASSMAPGQTGPYWLATSTRPATAVGDGPRLNRPAPEFRIRRLYGPDTVIDESDPSSVSAWFTPDLAVALTRLHQANDGIGVGFGYLVDGQDSDLSTITYTFYEAGSDGQPGMRVRFSNFGQPVDLDFKLHWGSDWVIANIRSLAPDGNEKWNLRDVVAAGLREAEP